MHVESRTINKCGKMISGYKSNKKLNEQRKLIKKQYKQEAFLKALEQQELLRTAIADNENVGNDIFNNDNKKCKENPSTITIAVPSSILENAQSFELRTYLAGQIARAACIFRVNEIIVFDDLGLVTNNKSCLKSAIEDNDNMEINGGQSITTVRRSCLQMQRILQYLECPQYLRKYFFPLHNDLKYSGLLNPLDAPHHLRQQNVFSYREGVVTERPAKKGQCYVNVGLLYDVLVNKSLKAGLRVTVKLNQAEGGTKKLRGCIVSPDEPRRETGVYWGYSVRIANSFSEIFTQCPYANGYDITVGTSDRGKNIQDLPSKGIAYNHMLIVFGGLCGLEAAIRNDDKLHVDGPELLFDHYINVLPQQGSRTIRTEEAILIALTALQEKICAKIPDIAIKECIKYNLPQSLDTCIVKKRCLGHVKQNHNDDIDCEMAMSKPNLKVQKNSKMKSTEQQPQQQNELKIKHKKPMINPFKTQPICSEQVVVDFEIVPPINTNVMSSVKRQRQQYLHENNVTNNNCNRENIKITEDLSRFD